jgi:hypothetical protein
MVAKIFNFVSVSAAVGILFLFVTLWNLQSRDILYTHLEESEKATPTSTKLSETTADNSTTVDISTKVAATEPEPTRLSFLEIATKHGTDKVTTHHYNHSEFSPFPLNFQSNRSHSVRKIPRPNSRQAVEDAGNWTRV